MRKLKALAILIAIAMLLTGCGAANKSDDSKRESVGVSDTDSSYTDSSAKESKSDTIEKTESYEATEETTRADVAEATVGTAKTEEREVTSVDTEEVPMEDAGDKASTEVEDGVMLDDSKTMDSLEAIGAEVIEPEIPEPQINPEAGLLTAGEWCDNRNWGFFSNLVSTGRFDFMVYGIHPYNRVVVHASSSGTVVENAQVKLMNDEGMVLASAVTDYSGTAFLYYNVFGTEEQTPSHVIVTSNGEDTTVDLTEVKENEVESSQSQQGQDIQMMNVLHSYEVNVELVAYEPPAKNLDVMFVFDTTGSMGDELLYLQKEFEDIANRIVDQNTRFSVNFYRDEGDVYVVRSNEFTTDIQATSALINSECAMDGGDFEEAVDLALKNGVLEHDWDRDSVKLMFIILDAPPHDTEEVKANLQETLLAAAEKGIRIIPIASSGIDTATEALLRDIAMLTGGTYTFLTDDSGIGGSHLEPTIGSYDVGRILRTFKIKKNVEVTDNGKIII